MMRHQGIPYSSDFGRLQRGNNGLQYNAERYRTQCASYTQWTSEIFFQHP